MRMKVEKSTLSGSVMIPPSKSHTIRAMIIATLAEGPSQIQRPLDSADTRSCGRACEMMGATVEFEEETLKVSGIGSTPPAPDRVIDVGNSGTSLYFLMGVAALGEGTTVFDGDEQTRKRSAQNLIHSLNELGAEAFSTRANGCVPIVVKGRIRGGRTTIACPTSQYLSSLLLCSPLAEEDTEIIVSELNEAPYIDMTLGWLNKQGMEYSHEAKRVFNIPGGQFYEPFQERVCGDFSSATFFMIGAAITGSKLTLRGLDMNDTQGDKAVVHMLREMGAKIEIRPDEVTVEGGELKGCEFDLNNTPDALPAMAVAGCFAKGTTRLVNVPQARIKETDRIAAMSEVLNSVGGQVEELEDGLVIHGGGLKGGNASGKGDHRIVMSLAIAGLASDKPIEVDTAETAAITFPQFEELMLECGAKLKRLD